MEKYDSLDHRSLITVIKIKNEEIERLTAELSTSEGVLESLQNKFEAVTAENGELSAEYSRLEEAAYHLYRLNQLSDALGDKGDMARCSELMAKYSVSGMEGS